MHYNQLKLSLANIRRDELEIQFLEILKQVNK